MSEFAQGAEGKKWSVDAFATGIKSKYPEYQDFDNEELVGLMVEKYPEYKDQVDYYSAADLANTKEELPDPVVEESSKKKILSTDSPSTGETVPTESVSQKPENEVVAPEVITEDVSLEAANEPVDFLSSVSNTATNIGKSLSIWDDKLDLLTADVFEAALGKEMASSYFAWTSENLWGEDLNETRNNALKEIDRVESSMGETRGIIESAKKGDVVGLAAATVDAVGAIGTSIIEQAVLFGAPLVIDMLGSSIATYNSEKAESLGITTPELYENGDAEFGFPILIGALSYGLEKAGQSALVKSLRAGLIKKTGTEEVTKAASRSILGKVVLSNPNKEGMTELTQSVLESYSIAEARGEEFDAYEYLSSEEAWESYLMGAVGAGVLDLGISQANKRKRRSKEGTTDKAVEKEELTNEIIKSEEEIQDPATPNDEKEIIREHQKEVAKKHKEIIEEEQTLIDKFSEEDKDAFEDIDRKIRRQRGVAKRVKTDAAKAGVKTRLTALYAAKKAIEDKYQEGTVDSELAPVTEVVEEPVVEVAETPVTEVVEPAVVEEVVEAPVVKTKKKAAKKKPAPVVEKVAKEQTVEPVAEEPKAKISEKKLKEKKEVLEAAPTGKYKGLKSKTLRTERGLTSVIEKKDKRTGKTTRYEADVFVDPKTKKVTHSITEFVDGKQKGEPTNYDSIKSFRDAINKKVKAGAKETDSFLREVQSQRKTESSSDERIVGFVKSKERKIVASETTVEKITYDKSDGTTVELRLQVNGSNRQKGLPYATAKIAGKSQSSRKFDTKAQYELYRGELARRKNVKVEVIVSAVRTKDANASLKEQVQAPLPSSGKRVASKVAPSKPASNRKPFIIMTHAQVANEKKVESIIDGTGKKRLFQNTTGKNGKVGFYEVTEVSLAAGAKRYDVIEGTRFESKRDIVKSLKEESKPKAKATEEKKLKSKSSKESKASEKEQQKEDGQPFFSVLDTDKFEGVNRNGVSKKKLLEQARVAKAILLRLFPNSRIRFVSNSNDFDSAMDAFDNQGRNSLVDENGRAFTNKVTGEPEIFINLDNATLSTIAHELFHVYFYKVSGSSADLAVDMSEAIDSVLKKGNRQERILARRLRNFTKNYDKEARPEEYLAELTGQLAAYADTISDSNLQAIVRKIKNLVYKAAELLGYEDSLFASFFDTGLSEQADAAEYLDFIVGFANAMSSFSYESSYSDLEVPVSASDSHVFDMVSRASILDGRRESYSVNVGGQEKAINNVLSWNYLEDTEGRSKLESGMITTDNKLSDIDGKAVMYHQPDRAFTGEVKMTTTDSDGVSSEKTLMTGQGGVYYPLNFAEQGYAWASTRLAALDMAEKINKMVKINAGKAYIVLTIGTSSKSFSSTVNANGILNIIESLTDLPEYGVSKSELAKMVKDSLKGTQKYKKNPKADRIKNYILAQTDSTKILKGFELLMNPDVTTFDDRKFFYTKEKVGFLSMLNNHIKSKGDEKIIAWNSLLGNDVGLDGPLYTAKKKLKKTAMSITMLSEGIINMINEPVIQKLSPMGAGITGAAHVVIEITGEVSAVETDRKSENHHGSYPFAIKTKNKDSVKIKFLKSIEPVFNSRMLDLTKGTEFKYIDTSSMTNTEEIFKAEFINKRMKDKLLPSTKGMSEVVIQNPTKAQAANAESVIKRSEASYNNNIESYTKVLDMDLQEFKSYFIKEKARARAQTESKNNKALFGETYKDKTRVPDKSLLKRFSLVVAKQPTEMNFLEFGELTYDSDLAAMDNRPLKMKSKSSLSEREQESLEGQFSSKEDKNAAAKLKAVRSLSEFIKVVRDYALKAGLIYTPAQKKIRNFLEAMSSQKYIAESKIGKIGASLRKLVRNPEQLKTVESYMSTNDEGSKAIYREAILKMNRGAEVLAIADAMRAYIDEVSTIFLNDPLFDSFPESEFLEVDSYVSKSKENKGKTMYRVLNTKTGSVVSSELSKKEATELSEAAAMKDIIRGNLGKYLHTSYRFFKDKNFKITDKAMRKAIEGEYELAKISRLKELISSGMSEAEAIDALNTTKEIESLMTQARESMEKYVREVEASRESPSFAFNGLSSSSIKIPKSVFQRKKGVPEHIAELLGLEKDPSTKFTDTAVAMMRVLHKTQMVDKISKALGEDFVKDSITKEEDNSGSWKKVEDIYSPINGKYVKAEVFEMLQNKSLLQSDIPFVQGYLTTLKLMRKSKVLWNLPGWRKNLTGGWMFVMANGKMNPAFLKDLKRRAERTAKGATDQETELELAEMAEVGLIATDVNAGMMDLMDAAMNQIIDEDGVNAQNQVNKLWNKAKKLDSKLAEKYSAVDDYTKLIIYRFEKKSFAKKMYGKSYESLTESEQKKTREAAAEFVKQNTPTFSRLPKWYTRSFALVPFGDFLGFKLESWRSMTANISNAIKDIKKSSDKNLDNVQSDEYRKAGTSRLFGAVSAMSLRMVIPTILASLWLDDEDEEIADDAVLLRPSWMEGHSLIVKSISDNGDVSVYNYSLEDPYGEISDVITGNIEGIEDFVTPNMFVKLAVNLTEGKDAYGRDLYSSTDPAVLKAMRLFKYTTKSIIVPPSISSSVKYQENQMLIRDYKFNVGQQFYFNAVEYAKGKSYNELKGNARSNRLEALDDIRVMYDAVIKVGVVKNNPELIMNANKVLNRFGKIEKAYIQAGIEL